jgi:NADH-quinone oxidoreductase subunit N
MSAPVLWIFLPFILGLILFLSRNQRLTALLACLFTFLLTLSAWLLPIDTALAIGNFSFKIASSFVVLGRSLTLNSTDRSFLALIYGSVTVWFAVSPSVKIANRLIPLGMAIAALLVSALAVEPFLYAALLIEIAILLTIPLLLPLEQKPGKGLIRFLIFQLLAVPFILFSGWLLAGIEANPGDLGLVRQAAVLLGLGFAFLLSIFPFYSWIPMLAEEASPYAVGFILWMFPTVATFFGLGFLDRYSWLRDSAGIQTALVVVGGIMVASGGLLAAFQRHLGRIMGYAIIVEIGFSLLTISLGGRTGLDLFLLLTVPRAASLVIWAFALSILREQVPDLTYPAITGAARAWPLATSGLVLANLSIAGMPLLAGFPARQAAWEALAHNSVALAFWVLVGSIGLFAAAIRVLARITMAPEGTPWKVRESWSQRILLSVGFLALLLLGLFPQWVLPLWEKLPAMFTHLGQ